MQQGFFLNRWANSILYVLLCIFFLSCQKEIKTSPFTSFDGIKIAYTDEGKGDPVFLLHGFINTRKHWDRAALKKDLIAAGYRVIIPDQRGNGDSDKPHNPEAYANNAEVKDLMALADYLGIEEYEIVGYSRGSIVLAELLTEDKRIKKAVIGGMGIDFTNPDWEIRKTFAKAFGREIPLDDMTKGAVFYAKSIKADLKALSLLQYHQPATPISELERIKTKILILRGDKDDSNGSAPELQQHLSNSRLQIVSGDHNNTYKSQVFSDAVMAFLKE